AEVAAGRFRADLYHRLNVVAFRVPALRELPGCVVPLAEAFLRESAARLGRADVAGPLGGAAARFGRCDPAGTRPRLARRGGARRGAVPRRRGRRGGPP